MTASDWSTSATNAAIRFYLGMAGFGLARLFLAGARVLAVGVILPFLGLLIVILILDRRSDRSLSSGTKPARTPQTQDRKPPPRILGMPTGVLPGARAGLLGLTETIPGGSGC